MHGPHYDDIANFMQLERASRSENCTGSGVRSVFKRSLGQHLMDLLSHILNRDENVVSMIKLGNV